MQNITLKTLQNLDCELLSRSTTHTEGGYYYAETETAKARLFLSLAAIERCDDDTLIEILCLYGLDRDDLNDPKSLASQYRSDRMFLVYSVLTCYLLDLICYP